MRRVYRREVAPLAYTNPSVNLIALGGLVLMVAGVCALARCGLSAAAEDACQSLLTGLMVYLTQLHDEYPGHIEVLEADAPSASQRKDGTRT